MDMNRRQLFRFGAAAVLTAAVAPVASALSAPTLWGDGKHDDTEALQAALDGKPVTVAGERIIIDDGLISGGTYLTTGTIFIRRTNLTLNNIRLICAHDDYGIYMVQADLRFAITGENTIIERRAPKLPRPEGRG